MPVQKTVKEPWKRCWMSVQWLCHAAGNYLMDINASKLHLLPVIALLI